MSKQVMQQALEAIQHICSTTSATYRYDPEIVRKAVEALEEALEESNDNPLTESQEERLQRVEKGLEWLAKLHASQDVALNSNSGDNWASTGEHDA